MCDLKPKLSLRVLRKEGLEGQRTKLRQREKSYDKRVFGVKVASSCLMLSLSPPSACVSSSS